MKPLPALYLQGRILDVALTGIILARGGTELNPLWAGVYAHGWTLALGLQLILAAPFIWLGRAYPPAWLPLLAVSWFPVAWNLNQF